MAGRPGLPLETADGNGVVLREGIVLREGRIRRDVYVNEIARVAERNDLPVSRSDSECTADLWRPETDPFIQLQLNAR